jgi:type 1 glutamine amidotransferase
MSLVLALALQAALEREPIPVLVVSGANNHDWEWTSRSLERLLEESGRFTVDLALDPARELAEPQIVQRTAAFVLDHNGPRWGETAERAFLAAVEAGAGVVVVHAANNAFEGWSAYERLIGLCWRAGTGHGAFHPFDVHVVDREHPVSAGLFDLVAHPDELYHRLVPTSLSEYRVLATAFSAVETGGSGRDEPMVVVREHGQGRVFHTPLGHVWPGVPDTRAAQLDPQFANLIVRGTEWAATGRVAQGWCVPNSLAPYEARAGWQLLFDGQEPRAWRALGSDAFPARGWSIEDGWLALSGQDGGDLVTREAFTNFELELEFRTARGANSGIKYRFDEARGLGPEYQVLDDQIRPETNSPRTAAGALYDVWEATKFKRSAPGPHCARIVARGNRLEHWLDGERVVLAEVGGPEWLTRLGASKFAAQEGFGRAVPGRILLQDHGDDVAFRSIKLRDLDHLPGRPESLFDGRSLAGWRALGDAQWSVKEGAIRGRTGGGAHSFLATEDTFADFLLELELRVDAPGNSGLQVRSRIDENGRMLGYQVEIDPSQRAWSGGIYEEGGRGWLADLHDDEAARAAFRVGDWNRYRVECIGPTIRAWVNGVPTGFVEDGRAASGVIALQVHGGQDVDVRWRGIELRVLD